MPKSLPTDTLLTKEQRETAVSDLIDFFATERDEQIGIIAAEEILDAVLQTAGVQLYNKGIDDTLKLFTERMEAARFDAETQLKKDE